MESLEHAMKRGAPIIAEYLGGAVNCDAYHMTDPRADGLGVSSCIQSSLEDAGVSPEEVFPFFAHVNQSLYCMVLFFFLIMIRINNTDLPKVQGNARNPLLFSKVTLHLQIESKHICFKLNSHPE